MPGTHGTPALGSGGSGALLRPGTLGTIMVTRPASPPAAAAGDAAPASPIRGTAHGAAAEGAPSPSPAGAGGRVTAGSRPALGLGWGGAGPPPQSGQPPPPAPPHPQHDGGMRGSVQSTSQIVLSPQPEPPDVVDDDSSVACYAYGNTAVRVVWGDEHPPS
eukprot:gene44204-39007_t